MRTSAGFASDPGMRALSSLLGVGSILEVIVHVPADSVPLISITDCIISLRVSVCWYERNKVEMRDQEQGKEQPT